MRVKNAAQRLQLDGKASLAAIAARQHGLVTRAQAANAGLTRDAIRRRVAPGGWEEIRRGVFRMPGVPPTWLQSLLAACMHWGESAVVSHRCAAAIWALPGFGCEGVELNVPRGRKRISSSAEVVHRMQMQPGDVTLRQSIPVTTVARTLLDLAGVCEPDVVEEAIDDAVRRRLVSLPRLRWQASQSARTHGGLAAFAELLDRRSSDGGTLESPLERRVLRQIGAAGLPRPTPQFEIRAAGVLVARVDFAYPDRKVAVEVDGRRWHSSRLAWQRDLDRRNHITALGWRIVHVTAGDVAARTVGERVAAVLRQGLS